MKKKSSLKLILLVVSLSLLLGSVCLAQPRGQPSMGQTTAPSIGQAIIPSMGPAVEHDHGDHGGSERDHGDHGRPAGPSAIKLERYQIVQNTLSAAAVNKIVAGISCFAGTNEVLRILFLKNDAQIQKNRIAPTGVWEIYYPYNQYGDIVNMLEKGNANFVGDSAHPELAFIFTT